MEYYPLIRELPATERPRERLKQYGAASLSNSELVAIILRTGATSESVLNLSARLCSINHAYLRIPLCIASKKKTDTTIIQFHNYRVAVYIKW